MISHYNVISNIKQITLFDQIARTELGIDTHVALGVLPFSHIYGLTLVAHASQYRGDSVIVMPKFELATFLSAIQRFKIEQLSVVPPMLIQLISNQETVAKYDLSSVRVAFSGAAPLGVETIAAIKKIFPKWNIGQGYGTLFLPFPSHSSPAVC